MRSVGAIIEDVIDSKPTETKDGAIRNMYEHNTVIPIFKNNDSLDVFSEERMENLFN